MPKPHAMVEFVQQALRANANAANAEAMQAYMKTQQLFYGVKTPERRRIFREAKRRFPITSRREYTQIVRELWQGTYREENYQALEVAEHFTSFRTVASWPLYEHLVKTAPHWDTLDWIASRIAGPLIPEHRELEAKIEKWIRSRNMWVRRAALLVHLKHKQHTNTALLEKLILQVCAEEEFFIQKAIGWVLRQYAYTNPDWVRRFVKQNQSQLSNLSRREALKNL
jgi:3-methyladenine DNA glycosylase AlkD